MREVALGEALDLLIDHRGKTPKKLGGDFTDSGVKVVSAIHIKNGRINWEERERYVSESMFRRWMPARTRRGDVLLTSEAPLGEVAQVPDDGPLVLSQRLFALRGKSQVLNSTYLRYFLQSDFGRRRLLSMATGSTVSGIRQELLRKVQIPLPPVEEQERIAGVLGAFDDLIETNRRLAQHATELQRAAFLRATEGLPRVPISEVMRVEMGQSPPGNTYNSNANGLPFFQGVKDFGERYPAIRVYCSEPRRIAEPGDLLLAVRAPIGRINVATEQCATGRGLAILRSALPAMALQSLTSEADLWAAYEDEGTVFSSINRKVVSDQRIRWTNDPGLADTLESLDNLVLDCHEQNSALSRQRDELLPLLMSGKVRVRDVEAAVS